MKQFKLIFFNFTIISLVLTSCTCNDKKPSAEYESVANDPLNTRIYTLDNGLKVYMSVYKDAPRIQTYIAVGAGSKNDPHDATGLAHYLEHMLFKGTDKFGTKDFAKEEPLVNAIDSLFEVYRKTTDTEQRKKLYHVIDSVSGVAAQFAIANEYDKLMSAIGAKGTNAYTWVEQTVYVNDIPSNQMKKWLEIESERFRKPVMRLFHTELEAVYEEKNISLDSDDSKLWDAMLEGLFQKHTYGTQTTIGTVEHLKNPSLTEIKKYFDNNYIPNNMAICLSGDFNPDSAIVWIKNMFGSYQQKPKQEFVVAVEDEIKEPIIKEVVGPDAAVMALGFRFGGFNSHDAEMITVIDKLLYNSRAGLIDLNLNQQQKVLEGWTYPLIMKDYSAHIMGAEVKQGQTLEEAKDLLLSQLELIKKGDFPDWLLEAVINDMKLQELKSYESNRSRADKFVESFVLGIPWQDYIARTEKLAKITKKELVDFANANYKNNYVVVYKRTGEDKNVQKVEKPLITPVEVNRESQSEFVKNILNQTVPDIEPVFVNYKEDIKTVNLNHNIPMLYKKNDENKTFNLYYILDMGSNNNKKLSVAIQYLPFLGTSKLKPAEVKQELYKLGCSFDVYNSDDQVWVSLSGLTENFEKGLALFEDLLADAQPNPEALTNLSADILKRRADAKLSKDEILWSAMYSYGVHGNKSPFTNILSEKELKELKPEEAIQLIKELTSFEHRVLYYGSEDSDKLAEQLNKLHKTPEALKPVPAEAPFAELGVEKTQVYVVNYDMQQAEVLMLSKSENYNKEIMPQASMFNEYFGGGMSSVVFQDMRESKALAYSVFASFRTPGKKEKANYVLAYIGTQADKLPEAMKGMNDLLNEMPESEHLFNAAKNAVIQKIRTERITKSGVLFSYERAKRLGLDYDLRKDVFEKAQPMKLEEVKAFHNSYFKAKNFNILVLGDKKKLDIPTLQKYGEVKYLTLEDVFGY